MMFEMVQVRIATGVTRVVWTAVVLRCGKQMEKLPHYYFPWVVSFQKQRYHICEMLPLETKLSGGKLLPNRISGGNVSRGNVMQALRQEEVQRAEGTSQLQDWNMELKDLESRKQTGEFENGNAEE